MKFGEERTIPALVYLFAINEVKEAFKEKTYKNTDHFYRILEHELHTNPSLPQELKQKIPYFRMILPKIRARIQLGKERTRLIY